MRRLAIISALILLMARSSFAAIPWNATVTTVTPSAGAGTCTLPAVCIFNLTGDLTSLTLSGGSAGSSYSLIFVQDATGGRSFTVPTNLKGGPFVGTPLPSIPSTANAWTVWVIFFDGVNYMLQGAYDGLLIFDEYANTYQSLGTLIATRSLEREVRAPSTVSVIFPGMTPTSTCWCVPELDPGTTPHSLPTTWQTGIQSMCIPDTNSVTCALQNPTAISITPVSDLLNIRGLP